MAMQTVLFTKLFRGRTTEEMAEATANLGFDGIDLLIRSGHQVEPQAPDGIQTAVNTIQAAGLSVPMATTDITDPSQAPTEAVLSACAEAGIELIRLGYWKYDPATGYAAILETARQHLDQLAEIAQRTGIQLAIQLHGGTIHASGAQTAVLLSGHDPRILGAYPDPGNQVVQDGREDWRFTFDVLKPWLCCVGVKNGGWFAGEVAANGQRRWHADWLGIPDGMVPWDDIVSYLSETGFDGELTFHSHYEVPLPQVLDQTRVDLNFVRRLIEARTPVLA